MLSLETQEAQKLVGLSRSDPKGFWRKTKGKRNNVVGDCDFEDYFRKLYDLNPTLGLDADKQISDWEIGVETQSDGYLDSEISKEELNSAIKNLKSHKATGCDDVLNEFICNGGDRLKHVFLKLFNAVFNTGCFPKSWAEGEIVPVFKKADRENPENYRGITLISCIGKLFTSI